MTNLTLIFEPFTLLKEMKSSLGNLNRLGADDFLSLSNQAFFYERKRICYFHLRLCSSLVLD